MRVTYPGEILREHFPLPLAHHVDTTTQCWLNLHTTFDLTLT